MRHHPARSCSCHQAPPQRGREYSLLPRESQTKIGNSSPLYIPRPSRPLPVSLDRLYDCYFPSKHSKSTPSRSGAPASGGTRVVRAPLGDAVAQFRWHTGSTDGGASRRSLAGPSRLVPPCQLLRRHLTHMHSLCSSCALLAEGSAFRRWHSTIDSPRTAPPGGRVVVRADRGR